MEVQLIPVIILGTMTFSFFFLFFNKIFTEEGGILGMIGLFYIMIPCILAEYLKKFIIWFNDVLIDNALDLLENILRPVIEDKAPPYLTLAVAAASATLLTVYLMFVDVNIPVTMGISCESSKCEVTITTSP